MSIPLIYSLGYNHYDESISLYTIYRKAYRHGTMHENTWDTHDMVRIKVKEIAKSKDISQSKLSRLADVNVSTLQRIYRNPTDTNINILTLEKIAKALGVDVFELIESTPDSER